MTRFVGKIAVVTGAADGIGRATSVALAKEGAQVLIVDIDKDRLEQTAKIIKDANGTVEMHIADVSKKEAVQGYVNAAVETFGGIDIFFNNAGVVQAFPLTDYPEEEFDKVIAVNVRGVFLGLKYVLKEMLKKGTGSIINTGSMASTGGIPYLAAYTASKHAVVGLTKTAALEVATTGIRVNAVLPGNIATKMTLAPGKTMEDEDAFAGASAATPRGVVGLPEDIANAVCFLASDESKYINGIVVPVDAGITAQVYPSSSAL